MQVSNGVIPLPVARFAREKVLPHVQRMDETSTMDKSIIDGLFEQGVRTCDVWLCLHAACAMCACVCVMGMCNMC